jgi:hypothetical protein
MESTFATGKAASESPKSSTARRATSADKTAALSGRTAAGADGCPAGTTTALERLSADWPRAPDGRIADRQQTIVPMIGRVFFNGVSGELRP